MDHDWISPVSVTEDIDHDENDIADVIQVEDSTGKDKVDIPEGEEELLSHIDRAQPGICLQPVDTAQELQDQPFDSVLCIAPAEGNRQIQLLEDMTN